MSRHLNRFELIQFGGNSPESLKDVLFDFEYIKRHLETCFFCKSRLTSMTLLEPPLPRPWGSIDPIRDEKTTGAILWPVFIEGVHDAPACDTPLLALSDISVNAATGLPCLTVVNLHDSDGFAADGDIALDTDDAGLADYFAGMWSMREILAGSVDLEAPLGRASEATMVLIGKFIAGNKLTEEEYNRCETENPGGNGNPVVDFRREILFEYHTLSADLFQRSEFTARAAGILGAYISDGVFPADPPSFIGFDKLLNYFCNRYQGGENALNIAPIDETRLNHILEQCEQTPETVASMLVLAARNSNRYLNSGLPADMAEAEMFLTKLDNPSFKYPFLFTGFVWDSMMRATADMAAKAVAPLLGADQDTGGSKYLAGKIPLQEMIGILSKNVLPPPEIIAAYTTCRTDGPIDRNHSRSSVRWEWEIEELPFTPDDKIAVAVLHLATSTPVGFVNALFENGKWFVVMDERDILWDTLPDVVIATTGELMLIIGIDV